MRVDRELEEKIDRLFAGTDPEGHPALKKEILRRFKRSMMRIVPRPIPKDLDPTAR